MGDTQQVIPEDYWKFRWTVPRNNPGSLLRPTQAHPFQLLPPELRNLILDDVDWSDQRALRAVCKLFKYDVEQVHGLRVVIRDSVLNLGHNRRWLEGVLVRSLDLICIGNRVLYDQIKLRDPHRLHTLHISFVKSDFSNPVTVETLRRILDSSSRIKELCILLYMDVISSTNFSTIYLEVLSCLGTKPHLKKCVLGVTKNKLVENGSAREWRLKGRGFQIMPDPNYECRFQFPMKLSTLSLFMPILSRRDFLGWKAFLDSQDQLENVFVLVGLASWHFFEKALRQSASTLRIVSLSLAVPEIHVQRDEDIRLEYAGSRITYNGPGEEDHDEHPASFNWAMLSGTKLEKLMVFRPSHSRRRVNTIRCHNFVRVQISRVTDLRLQFVQLTTKDLTRIFMEGVSLSSIYLADWNLRADWEDDSFCLEQSLKIWVLLSIMLQERRFIYFSLLEYALDLFPSPVIASAVQQVVASQNKLFYRQGGIWTNN